MNWIWTGFLALSLACAWFTGQTGALASAALEGAGKAVELALQLAGPLCLWSGVSRLSSELGLTRQLSRLLAPLLRRLFPRSWQDSQTRENLCGNVSANLLGLGSAATPMGIRTVQGMLRLSGGQVSDEMCRLIVMNTASIQLIPTTVAAVRAGLGAAAPFDILPSVWLTSLGSVTVGLLAAEVLRRWL